MPASSCDEADPPSKGAHLSGHENLRARSVRGVAWVAADKWTNRVLAFAILLILARLLDPVAFGTVALANVFITLLGVVANLGFASYIQRAPTLTSITTNTAFWVSMGLSLVLYGLLAIAAPFIAALFNVPQLREMLWVLGAVMPLAALSSVPSALLMRDIDMKPLALRRVVSSVLGGIVAVVLAFSGAGVWALVFQLLTSTFVGTVLIFALTRWHPNLEFSLTEAKRLTRFGVNVVGSQLVHQLRDRGDELLIGGLLGPHVLGFWVIATRIMRTALDLFTSVVTTVSLSSFAKVADDRPRLINAIRATVSASALLVVPGLAALAIVTPVLIPFAFGTGWDSAIVPAQIITLAAILNAIQWVDANVWYAIGRSGTEFLLTVIISAVHLVLVGIAALTGMGLVVVAIAVLIRIVTMFPLRFLMLRFVAKIPLRIYGDLWRIGLSAGVMALAMVGVSPLLEPLPALVYLLLEALVGGIVYLGMIVLVARALAKRMLGDVRSLRGPRARPA